MNHKIYWNEQYTNTHHAFDTTRKSKEIAEQLGPDTITDPSYATPLADQAIQDTIHPRYYDALQTGAPKTLSESNGFEWDPGIWEMALNSTAGVIYAAADAYRNQRIAGSLSSGLHHANNEHGSGFCTVNGLAVASNFMLKNNPHMRIAILDFDAHCGGGTVTSLRQLGIDRHVEQYDISTDGFDSYRQDNTHTIKYVKTDEEYLNAVQEVLNLLPRDENKIDLVLYNAGTDPYPTISKEALQERENMVFYETCRAEIPVAYVLAGGYTFDQTMEELVQTHINTINSADRWAQTWNSDEHKHLKEIAPL
jgi:acetoin utilization deacetylase AcuC-like enzyme